MSTGWVPSPGLSAAPSPDGHEFRENVADLICRASDEALRQGSSPVQTLRTVLGPRSGRLLATETSRRDAVLIIEYQGQWYAAFSPVCGLSDAFGWETWSGYVRRQHLLRLVRSAVGPTSSPEGLAQEFAQDADVEKAQFAVAAALSGLSAQEREAAEFLVALMGFRATDQARKARVREG